MSIWHRYISLILSRIRITAAAETRITADGRIRVVRG